MDAMPEDGLDRRIEAIWNDLAEFDASRHDEALDYLMQSLCALVDAQNATWLGTVRFAELAPDDPIHGWRVCMHRFLHPRPALETAVRQQASLVDEQRVDPNIARNVAAAGHLRANRLEDLVSPEWFASEYYRRFFLEVGRVDAIWAGCPVNEDAEVYIGLFRAAGKPRFSVAERDVVVAALRGLKWFHRQYLLSHGLLVASGPLTPVEREVLHGLLAGQTEKEIARAQERGLHTVHEYVKALYRKFGVKNRSSLMALWLGKLA